jgi:nitrite reductase/ring-hydroxylating ferredoxin subunit
MPWIAVAEAAKLKTGEAIEVLVDGEVIAIFRTLDGLYAIDGICAHQGGPISRGKVDGDCVTCPWHGWRYRLSNGNNANTDKPMLKSYNVRETDGQIELRRGDTEL